MAIRPGRAMTRKSAATYKAAQKLHTFPSPVRGLIANENLSLTGPGGATVLDNWFPTATGIRQRGGSRTWARLGGGSVESLFTYKTAAVERFFAADETRIFDVTIASDAPLVVVGGQTEGRYSTAQMANPGGEFLFIVNGRDVPRRFDGTTWAVPPITSDQASGPLAIVPSRLSFVWTYASRLFFIEKGTMTAWCLPVDAIQGKATRIALDGVFQLGGSLLFGATWSTDSGSGMDDMCVFVTTAGEVAVFQGTNPGDPANWTISQRYVMAPPLGPLATMRMGGNLAIATEDGLVPLSEAMSKDIAALSLGALSRAIEPLWRQAATRNRGEPWEIVKWPRENMAIVTVPASTDQPYCFVANLQTGAWSRYTGWDMRCVCVFGTSVFFGTRDGRVVQAEIGGNDDGAPYVSTYVGLFEHLGSPGSTKTIHTARPTFLAGSPVVPKVSVSVDYTVQLSSPPSSPEEYRRSEWDVGLYDQAVWDSGTMPTVTSRWVSIGRTGFSIAPQIQLTSGITPRPLVELVAFDIVYEDGGVMV